MKCFCQSYRVRRVPSLLIPLQKTHLLIDVKPWRANMKAKWAIRRAELFIWWRTSQASLQFSWSSFVRNSQDLDTRWNVIASSSRVLSHWRKKNSSLVFWDYFFDSNFRGVKSEEIGLLTRTLYSRRCRRTSARVASAELPLFTQMKPIRTLPSKAYFHREEIWNYFRPRRGLWKTRPNRSYVPSMAAPKWSVPPDSKTVSGGTVSVLDCYVPLCLSGS